MLYFVYIIYSKSSDAFYIGCSADPHVRLEEHNHHHFDDSFTRRASDWKLFWVSEPLEKTVALRIEKHIKQMKSRKYLYNLKQHPDIFQRLTELYGQG